MAFSVVMPALEMAQETGKLVSWRKKEGESVAKGEPLLEVETDKAVLEVEAPADGILSGITVNEGAVVPVGVTIAWIVRPGESVPSKQNEAPMISEVKPSRSETSYATRSPREDAQGARLSPKARRLAREQGIDVSGLHGSGPGGAVIAADIPQPAATETPGTFESLGTVGRLMAERTTQSWTSVPHFFVTREADATALTKAREQWNSVPERQTRATHTDLLVAAVSRVLKKHPRINASWAGDNIRLNPEVNISIAIAVEGGVVATVIHNADGCGVAQIASQRNDLGEKAKANRLRPSDVSGATFTISNLGMFQVDAFSAIINPPQVAILAVGAIKDRVIAVDGRPEVRPMMTLTLSCDHRVVDGARAASFLNDLVEKLREPEKWLR